MAKERKNHFIGIGKYRFDPEDGEPDFPDELRLSDEEKSKYEFHLVQLSGRLKKEWLQELRLLGGEIIEYIPRSTYLVKISADSIEKLKELDFVRWGGLFRPAYKISRNLEGKTGVIKNVNILVYDDGTVEKVLEKLEEQECKVLRKQKQRKTKTVAFQKIVVEVDASKISDLAKIPSIRWIEYISPVPIHQDEISCQLVAGNIPPAPGFVVWLNSDDIDLDGDGETIAVADTGFDTNDDADCHLDVRGRLTGVVIYTGSPATDTNGHGTHVAGITVADASTGTTDGDNYLYGQGMAPSADLVILAHFWLQDMSDYTKDAVTRDAYILNCSWGDGDVGTGYGISSAELDKLVRDANPDTDAVEPLVIIFAAGNYGWHESPGYLSDKPVGTIMPNWGYRDQSIASPQEAKNLIVVGATKNLRPNDDATVDVIGHAGVRADNIDDLARFSSRGPSEDDRIVPTIVAPGMMISSLRSDDERENLEIDDDYVWMSGTSQAAPHVAGTAALLCQWWKKINADKTPSPAMIKALLINGAVDLAGGSRGDEPWWVDNTGTWQAPPPPGGAFVAGVMALIPSYDQGWGRINLGNIINAENGIYKDQTSVFSDEGQHFTIKVTPHDTAEPLKITLVWSDAAAATGANPTLVNDLDLEVTEVSTGNIYRGNWFPNPSLGGVSTGWSVAGGQRDDVNNVECVYIQNPQGSYEVKIVCTELNGDAIPPFSDEPEDFRQDFALVISNAAIQTGDPVDVVLSIDRTGSMAYFEYIQPAKERAKEFVDMMQISDHVGVVSFAIVPDDQAGAPAHYKNKKVYTEFDLQEILTNDVITDAKNAIDGIWCEQGPTTSIGAGLQEAQTQIDTNGSDAPDSIVLLSDGYENDDPYVEDVMPGIPATTTIHTISLGEIAATELLEQIAEDRNGKYFHAAGPLEIAECYYRIRSAVTGESISMLETDEVEEDEDPTHTIIIDSCTKKATFAVSWLNPESTLGFQLKDPNGRIVNKREPMVQFKEGSTYKFYIVSSPIPGTWRVHVSGDIVPVPVENYTTVAFVDSSLTTQAFLAEGQRLVVGKPFIVCTQILHAGNPVLDAQVTADVIHLGTSVKDRFKGIREVLDDVKLAKEKIEFRGKLFKTIDEVKMKEFTPINDTIPDDQMKLWALRSAVRSKMIEVDPKLMVTIDPSKPMFPVVKTTARKLHHAGNGVYLDLFTQTEAEGPYIIRINTVGHSPLCSWFSRNDAIAINIPAKERTYTGSTLRIGNLLNDQILRASGFPLHMASKVMKVKHLK